jgi:hypothetical protein
VKSPGNSPWHWIFAAQALVLGLLLRLYFVFHFPTTTGDGPIYESLAHNWLAHGVYGFPVSGTLTPVDIRLPGYPAFILIISWLFGRSQVALMLAQVFLDLGTCVLAALLAGRLVPPASTPEETTQARRRVQLAGLWLAALCPFLANYAAVPLTEVPAAFFTAAALLAFSWCFSETPEGQWLPWFVGGVATAFGTLVRPETPLLLIAFAIVCMWRWRRPRDWRRLLRVGALTAAGFLLPMMPWVIRNAKTFHEFRLLAPRYANENDEVVPVGFYAWTKTWLVRYGDVYVSSWKLESEPLQFDEIRASAFDNADERRRVAALFEQYNNVCCDIPPGWDAQFAQLAQERTQRHPLRTYVWIPFARSFVLWLTPRIELLPYSGKLWPPGEMHRDEPDDFDATLELAALGFLYAALGIAGFVRVVRYTRNKLWPLPKEQVWIAAFLAVFCVIRTGYLVTVETPEPRYVLECFPALFAFAAFLFLPRSALRSSVGASRPPHP